MTVAPTQGLEDLREVISAYNGLAERLQSSQHSLQREVMRLRDELEEKNRQLARKNRLEILGEMAAGVAHEIRNPLGGIELYAGLIAREATTDERIAKWVQKIRSATHHLSRTVGEILDFTKPLCPQAKGISAEEIIETALDLASSSLGENGVRVERAHGGGAEIMGDFNLLLRAFLNVILNAADAMPRGGILRTGISPATLGEEAAWRMDFADSGEGIAVKDMAKIFDPFFTRKEGGTGLGLAMTMRIVAAHNGRLEASNAEGGGAVFSFTLPAANGDKEKA